MQPDDIHKTPGGTEAGFAPLTFDPTAFIAYVEDADLTEAQQYELLGAVWAIMVAFVDVGFGIHPVQQALDKSQAGAGLPPLDASVMLSCKDDFSKHAKTSPAKGATRPLAERKES